MPAAEARRVPGAATAMLAGAAVAAGFVAGKAVRDAVFLAHLDTAALPAAVFAGALVSIALALLGAKTLPRASIAVSVPVLFVASGALFLAEWGLLADYPALTAAVLFLHVSGLGPMLGSGLWLVAAERFDPRAARAAFGGIAAAGTLGGVAGGVLVDRLAATAGVQWAFPALALLSLLAGWQVRRLALPVAGAPGAIELPPDLAAAPASSSLAALAREPYLRNLAAVVLLGSLAATLLDYLLRVEAVASLGQGGALVRFFSIYYSLAAVLTFALQSVSSRRALERLGLAGALATPSFGVVVGGAGALLAPGLGSLVLARGAESIARGSFFKSAYEVFFTPLSPGKKRAAKSIIDVGSDRLGEAAGAGLVALVLLSAASAGQVRIVVLTAAMACALGVALVSRRLARGYIHALKHRLQDRAREIKLSDIYDNMTRTLVTQSMTAAGVASGAATPEGRGRRLLKRSGIVNVELLQIMALRSGDRARILNVLDPANPLSARVAPHAIPLLEVDAVASDALRALSLVADARAGELTDALLDAGLSATLRRRVAGALAGATTQRAADGLMLGLEAEPFDVRERSGRSLAAIRARNPAIRIDAERVVACALRAVAAVDERGGNGHALEHVFTLLSLVLPEEPLRIAYRGVQSDDPALRGTALEYLEGVLPPAVREALLPRLDAAAAGSAQRQGGC